MHDALDEALERLRGAGAEVAGRGAPNHGPMAAEALTALGRADEVVAWAERYRRRLGPMSTATAPVAGDTWMEALGAIDRIGDWTAFFRIQLAEAPWRAVFREWIERLLPGIASAGAHGLIRTAHALRGLEHAATPLRVEELGVALAYWAAYYRELPGIPRLTGTLALGDALGELPLFLRGQPRRGKPREVYLRVARAHVAEFSAAVDRAANPASADDAISALTEAGARTYLANASRQPLVLLHTVTVPAALRLLLPYLPSDARRTALAYVWQNVAATTAAYADDRPAERDEWAALDPSAIVERSVATDDPHAIKFAEACIREFRSNPQPVYLAVADDWATRVCQAKGWSAAELAAAGIDFQ